MPPDGHPSQISGKVSASCIDRQPIHDGVARVLSFAVNLSLKRRLVSQNVVVVLGEAV